MSVGQRSVKKLSGSKWVEIPFEDLKPGDKFKLYEEDGALVKAADGNSVFVCESFPFKHDSGNLSVKCEPICIDEAGKVPDSFWRKESK